jgi:hypothetical protein
LKVKATKVLPQVGAAPLAPEIVDRLAIFSRFRNEYVHYKWRPINEMERQERLAALAQGPTVVAYLRDYEDEHVFRRQRERIRLIVESSDWDKVAELMPIERA